MAVLLHAGRITTPLIRSQPHQHDREELCLYLTGRGTAWIGDRAIPFAPGTLIRFPPRQPHHEHAPRGTTLIWLGTDTRSPASGEIHHLDENGTVRRIFDLICDLGGGSDALPAQQRLFDAAEVLLADPAEDGPEDRLRLAIEAGHRDAAFDLPRAMASCGGSPDHLRRRFVARFGLPPVRYLARLRIETAKGLLRRGGTTVAAVAEQVGLPDPYYFSRSFRAWTGTAPSRWVPDN